MTTPRDGESIKLIEAEGKTFVARARTDENGAKVYSLDGGATWEPTIVDAYLGAKKAGTLETEPEEDQESFQAWTVSLLREIQSLAVGESLKITRDTRSFLVLREKVVLTCPTSAIRDIDIRTEEEGGDGEGRTGLQEPEGSGG